MIAGLGSNDTLLDEVGSNTLGGSAGMGTANFSGATAGGMMNLGTGSATGEGSDSLSNIENVTGSNFNDNISGDTGNNVLNGGADNDTLDGSAGIDTTSFAGSAAVTANLAAGTPTGQGSDTLSNIESVIDSNAAGNITGNGC